jgi:hypothetical protein
MDYTSIYKVPIKGIEIYQEHEPEPGRRLIGYRLVKRRNEIFTKPNIQRLSIRGWIQSFLCCLCGCPCLPFFLSTNYNIYQTPVYSS